MRKNRVTLELPVYFGAPGWIGKEPEGWEVIAADPAWSFADRGSRIAPDQKKKRQGRKGYRTLSVEQIAAIPVAEVAAKDALLFLWTTSAHLVDGSAARVAQAWGFTPKATIAWVKVKPPAISRRTVRLRAPRRRPGRTRLRRSSSPARSSAWATTSAARTSTSSSRRAARRPGSSPTAACRASYSPPAASTPRSRRPSASSSTGSPAGGRSSSSSPARAGRAGRPGATRLRPPPIGCVDNSGDNPGKSDVQAPAEEKPTMLSTGVSHRFSTEVS
jgi:hypothetical protein